MRCTNAQIVECKAKFAGIIVRTLIAVLDLDERPDTRLQRPLHHHALIDRDKQRGDRNDHHADRDDQFDRPDMELLQVLPLGAARF
jgi:hypothetical protein